MKDKTTIAISDKLEMVGFIKGNGTACRFVSMLSETEPKLRAGSPFKGVKKISRKNGMINVRYNDSVRRRIAAHLGLEMKEVEYENGEVWFTHLQTGEGKSLPLVVNKNQPDNGKVYLQYFPTRATNTYVMPNGDTVSEETIQKWLYAKNIERFKPVTFVIEVANIKELRASGIIMQTEDVAEAEAALEKSLQCS